MKKIQLNMTPDLSIRTIKYFQEKEGMDLKEIAKLIGSSPAYLSQVLKGQKILLSRHLTKLEEEKPNLYLALLPAILAEKFEGGVDFIKKQSKKLKGHKGTLKDKGKEGLQKAKGISAKVALAVCKLLTKENET